MFKYFTDLPACLETVSVEFYTLVINTLVVMLSVSLCLVIPEFLYELSILKNKIDCNLVQF